TAIFALCGQLIGASLMIDSFLLLRRAEDRAEQLEVLVEIVACADVVDDVIHFVQTLDVRRHAAPRWNSTKGGDDFLSFFGKQKVAKQLGGVGMRRLGADSQRLKFGKD